MRRLGLEQGRRGVTLKHSHPCEIRAKGAAKAALQIAHFRHVGGHGPRRCLQWLTNC